MTMYQAGGEELLAHNWRVDRLTRLPCWRISA
jgi:hypothetical protein